MVGWRWCDWQFLDPVVPSFNPHCWGCCEPDLRIAATHGWSGFPKNIKWHEEGRYKQRPCLGSCEPMPLCSLWQMRPCSRWWRLEHGSPHTGETPWIGFARWNNKKKSLEFVSSCISILLSNGQIDWFQVLFLIGKMLCFCLLTFDSCIGVLTCVVSQLYMYSFLWITLAIEVYS
jgi:hypothetical protein